MLTIDVRDRDRRFRFLFLHGAFKHTLEYGTFRSQHHSMRTNRARIEAIFYLTMGTIGADAIAKKARKPQR